jgi:peptide/nickel transport system substrate-binding protein
VNGVFINTKREPFNDVLVRQAVAYAINRQQIIETVHQGYGKPAKSPIAPANERYFNAEVEGYSFDLQRAKELLRESGLRVQNGQLVKPVDWEPTTTFVGVDG